MTTPSAEDAELLREIVDGILKRRPTELQHSITGLTFMAPGMKVVRAMVWAVYNGMDPEWAAGVAAFGDIYPDRAEGFPQGVHKATAEAYADWFKSLKVNIPAPEETR